jgi:hypothetical protein
VRAAAAFKKAGNEPVHIGLQKGTTVSGKKSKTQVNIEKAIKDLSENEFNALLIHCPPLRCR